MPHGTPDFFSSFNFSLKQIVEFCTKINSLQVYNNIFWCLEVLVLKKKLRQTANFDNFLLKLRKIREN